MQGGKGGRKGEGVGEEVMGEGWWERDGDLPR